MDKLTPDELHLVMDALCMYMLDFPEDELAGTLYQKIGHESCERALNARS